ncbi:dipeptidyl aminopeptidase [Phanerochaete sordida]|uniref:Dipeptidyl aminopeptidase n=1 Tax=Phanerochaete sordida TaxID=48140 RepID=A0A9P3LH82_9APHY|nr:dipeptidyl aminopeptidase [Phanerochaete sordida]
MPTPDYSPVPLGEDGEPDTPSGAKYPPEVVKPMTYYGEGEFDPPSSDDEGETLLEKSLSRKSPGDAEEQGEGMGNDDGELVVGGKKHPRPASLRWLVICLTALVATAALIGVFAAFSYHGTSFQIHGTQHITMEHIFNGTFTAQTGFVRWVPEAGDGVFATSQNDEISLVDLKYRSTLKLVTMSDVKDAQGTPLQWSSWELSSDMKYMLIKSDHVKQWRHSSFGNYYIHDLTTHTTHPLIAPSNPPLTAFAKWSPTGQAIAYVTQNDLYILPHPSSSEPIQITSSGNASLFHGVPDWVYEEEVFSADYALWWSPDSAKLAYLRFDETAVDEFTFPVYNPTENSYEVVPYPGHVTMKYPKPGYSNPLVSIHVFELDRYEDMKTAGDPEDVAVAEASLELTWDHRLAPESRVVQDVTWVSNSTLLVEELDRSAVNGSIVLFNLQDAASGHGQIVRTLGQGGEEGDDGWIEAIHAIHPLHPRMSAEGTPGYLDIVPSKDGYNHIALYNPPTSKTPQFVTSGKWEVTDILAVDSDKNLVYYLAANPSSLERHVYYAAIPKANTSLIAEPVALTDRALPGYYSASFSPQAGYYLLTYSGPNVPWQRIIQAGNATFDYPFVDNSALNATLAQYELPVVTHTTIESDGFELNVREIRPPRMDDSGKTKYPVLFHVYGGPGSQQVSLRYGMDWHYFLAAYHKYIVVIVDGRGTGFKGRHLRNPVKDNLGHWETIDQIYAAKLWAAKEYVDPKRIGIWGWSYGGFMSCKVAEANAGVHSLAMAVAPVTSWRLYDSIYTERYMNLPQANPDGYVTASISNVTGFHNLDFLFAHGSGDDNVHFANSAHLLDMLTADKVRGFRFRMFTDSDHSIYKRGANREVYEFMHNFLVEKWGKGPRQRGL